MPFITDEDYTVLIRDEIKDILLEEYSDSKLRISEQFAISQIENYLNGRYDTDLIFEAEGIERNSHIVMLTIDCVLYHLYTSNQSKQMPSIRANRYQDAIDWLKMVGTGQATAKLPKIKNESGEELQGIKITSKYSATNQRW